MSLADAGRRHPPLRVIADDREEGGGVVDALRQMPGIQVTVERLKVGDYQVESRCVFERKTLADFAASIADGRLFAQARALAAAPLPAALILEGRASDLAANGMRREAMQGALISLSLVFHLPVLRAREPRESAQLILYAGDQLRRLEHDGGLRPGRRPAGQRRRQLRVLQSLPGVGPVRADRLLAAFGSVGAVMAAEGEALQAVAGLGPKRAAAIRETVVGEGCEAAPRPEYSI